MSVLTMLLPPLRPTDPPGAYMLRPEVVYTQCRLCLHLLGLRRGPLEGKT